MIKKIFEHTVSSLCYSVIQVRCKSSSSISDFPHNDVVRFVLEQHSRMPDYLQFPILFLTLIFDLVGLFFSGSLFHTQPHPVRWHQIATWKNSPISICRDFIRFYESLVVLCWQSYHNRSQQLGMREVKEIEV